MHTDYGPSRGLAGVMTSALLVAALLPVSANPVSMEVNVGQSVVVPIPYYKSHALGSGADQVIAVEKRDGKLFVIGRRPGQASLLVWDSFGDRTEYSIRVATANGSQVAQGGAALTSRPRPSGDATTDQIERAINRPDVHVSMQNGRLVIEGTVGSEMEKERATRIAEQWATREPIIRLRVKPASPTVVRPIVTLPATGLAATVAEPKGIPIAVTTGQARIITTTNNLVRVAVADEEIADPVVASAREVILIGKQAGVTTCYVWEQEDPEDVLGARSEYEVTVSDPAPPPSEAEQGPPPISPEEQADEVRIQVEDALNNPDIEVIVIPNLSGSAVAGGAAPAETPGKLAIFNPKLGKVGGGGSAAREAAGGPTSISGKVAGGPFIILRGTVDSAEAKRSAGEIASLFGSSVLNHIKIEGDGTEDLLPQTDQELRLQQIVQRTTGLKTVRVYQQDDNVVLQGVVPTRVDYNAAERVARAFGENVTNLLDVAEAQRVQQVLTEVKIIEIDRTALHELGVDWGAPQPTQTGTGGATAGASTTIGGGALQVGVMTWGEAVAPGDPFKRLDPLQGRLQALVQNGAARVLSQPNLLTVEGIQGNIAIGGQVPIPATTSTGGTGGGFVSQTFEYRTFGILLQVRPEASDDGHIALQLGAEVSALDFTNSIVFQNTRIPGFRLRKTSTGVVVRDGDVIVVGGLIQEEDRQNVNAIPLLSKIPIIGELFKSRRFERGETELVIFLTPHLVEQDASAETIANVRQLQQAKPLETFDANTAFEGLKAPIEGGGGG